MRAAGGAGAGGDGDGPGAAARRAGAPLARQRMRACPRTKGPDTHTLAQRGRIPERRKRRCWCWDGVPHVFKLEWGVWTMVTYFVYDFASYQFT